MSLFFLLLAIHAALARLPACKKGEYRYEFTECDSAGGRWRVAVPRKPGVCEAIGLDSIRQKNCASTCDPGQYLDVNSPKQACKSCKPGHYSLGGDVIYTNWTALPSGFETKSYDETYESQWFLNHKGNCTNSAWKPMGKYLASGYDACTSQLTFAVTLKKDGSVTFTYQSPSSEIFFNVYVRNEQCMMDEGEKSFKYPPSTKNFRWNNYTVKLKRGHNLIVWQAALYPSKYERRQDGEPVLIKSIKVHGVAYTSECTPCPAGTYSDKEGSESCAPCPADHYSMQGATKCGKCDSATEYSRPGSALCSKKKPCTVEDYIETHSPCDSKNKFKKMFQWIEPKICRDDVNGATSLPVSGKQEDCPPCNPGMFMNGSVCDFCPPMTFSNGNEECKKCPASTEPNYGYNFHWWRNWPSNMGSFCKSAYERGCASSGGFQLRGNSIDSGVGHADDAHMLLYLDTAGFKSSSLSPGLGTITFEFEVNCAGPCVLKFYQLHGDKGEGDDGRYEKIRQWNGKQRKQKYTAVASSKHVQGLYWLFKKGSQTVQPFEEDDSNHFNYRSDKVTFYSIEITKTVDGGAASCQSCPVGMKDEGCIPCPKGNRVIPDRKGKPTCQPCGANTYLNVSDPVGRDACIACGDGLQSEPASTECLSDCKFTSKEGRKYDFTSLSGMYDVKTSALFTMKGTKYYYHFNISFCPKDSMAKASCYRNVSMIRGSRVNEVHNHTICRMTIVPRRGFHDKLAAQPMSTGDQLMLISTREVTPSDEVFGDSDLINSTVVGYHYHTNDITEVCSKGRSTVIHLVCDPHRKETKFVVPSKCLEGTCDGCRFDFVLYSSSACPLCTKEDYEAVVTGCVKGQKNTTFMWKMPKRCAGGVSLPGRNSTTCSIFERSVKDFAIGLAAFAGFVVLMILAVFVLWYKNRRLEYKYHKLIQNASDRSGELPGAPQCVGDDEDEEEVQFKSSGGRGKRLFKNIKNKLSGETKLSDQYNFNNFSDDDTIEPTTKTPLS